MSTDERLDRIERLLERHIDLVGQSLLRLEEQVRETSQQVARTSASQEVTEERLQRLIQHVDHLTERLDNLEQ